MTKLNDLTGRTFGRLTVVCIDPQRTQKNSLRWKCTCICGKTASVLPANLINGHTVSCGCWAVEAPSINNVKHGCARTGKVTTEYHIWASMIKRCYNPQSRFFHRYGGRGISVCDQWINSFEKFYEDMGSRPTGMSLDRINNDGNYEPSNCRWATQKQQHLNSSRAIPISVYGEVMSAKDAGKKFGMWGCSLVKKLRNGNGPDGVALA